MSDQRHNFVNLTLRIRSRHWSRTFINLTKLLEVREYIQSILILPCMYIRLFQQLAVGKGVCDNII